MKQYKVISYDVWGNEDDGFEVNNAFYTPYTVEITDRDNDQAIVRKLIDVGYCSEEALRELELDPHIDHSHTIYLVERKNCKPFCELRPIEA